MKIAEDEKGKQPSEIDSKNCKSWWRNKSNLSKQNKKKHQLKMIQPHLDQDETQEVLHSNVQELRHHLLQHQQVILENSSRLQPLLSTKELVNLGHAKLIYSGATIGPKSTGNQTTTNISYISTSTSSYKRPG